MICCGGRHGSPVLRFHAKIIANKTRMRNYKLLLFFPTKKFIVCAAIKKQYAYRSVRWR